jgi:hypothetical protein
MDITYRSYPGDPLASRRKRKKFVCLRSCRVRSGPVVCLRDVLFIVSSGITGSLKTLVGIGYRYMDTLSAFTANLDFSCAAA